MQYLDSFGLPPPEEWLHERHVKPYVYNRMQIQAIPSVRCGYYCLLFLNERNKGTSYEDIILLKMFSPDVEKNKAIVKNFFFVIVYDGKPVLREGQKANALCKGTEKISLTKHS